MGGLKGKWDELVLRLVTGTPELHNLTVKKAI